MDILSAVPHTEKVLLYFHPLGLPSEISLKQSASTCNYFRWSLILYAFGFVTEERKKI